MMLMDLVRLIRRHWIVLLVCMLVCGAAAGMYAKMKTSTSYSATANVVGNSQVSAVLGYANAESRRLMIGVGDQENIYTQYTASAKQESGTQTAAITVTGDDEAVCIDLANQIAEVALKNALASYGNWENPYTGYVDKAEVGEVKTSGGVIKYLLVGLLGGLFVGICAVIAMDMVRRPVKSIEGVQNVVELPVLEKLPVEDSGERLFANVRFASKKDDIRSVCVIPVGDSGLAEEVCSLLKDAARAEGLEVGKAKEETGSADGFGDSTGEGSFLALSCDSLKQSMSGAYAARGADAAIVAVRQWSDSLSVLESTVAELKLAETNLVGIVLAPEKK